MRASLNWIRYLNDKYGCAADPAPKGVDNLVEKIGLQLGAVEEVIDLGEKYKSIIVVRVVSCVKHPNADKLSVCLVDDGKTAKNIKRDKNGLIEIVCGAPNAKAGMLAAWILPGNTVPSTFNKEPFVLEAREIRGVVSNGMLASAKELDLGDDHSGIVEIEENVKPGSDFAKAFRLDDHVIDIENKMFTHRPDCFGMLGVAREIAGIQNHKFKSPAWYKENAALPSSRARDDHKLSFKNSAPKLVARFSAAVIKDISVKQSPLHIKAMLSSAGVRPINNIVDLTNFFMLETAQPLHSYDYDKVLASQKDKKSGVKMGVRLSKKGDELKLLGGKQLKLDEGSILITADDEPIGLGGIMGGADTEVDENTKNIILECANFDMYQTRRTAMRYGLFTDAATRFTKGQSPRQNLAVLAKTAEDIMQIAGGRVSAVVDDKNFSSSQKPVQATVDFIESRLGEALGAAKIKQLLENVEFQVAGSGQKLSITPPFWRTDIEIPEDIVEEIGRLYGYEHLPQTLPGRDLSPAKTNAELDVKDKIRETLSSAGANEVLTYSFAHGNLLKAAGQDASFAFKIANALSPDLQYYRLSLTPSLLEKVHPNIKSGYDFFGLFEIGKAHAKSEIDSNGLPGEFGRVAMVLAGNDKEANKTASGAAYFWAKRYLVFLMEKFGLELEFKTLDEAPVGNHKLAQQMLAPYEGKRSAAVFAEGKFIGVIGEFKQPVQSALKLPAYCAGFEVFQSAFNTGQATSYRPLNRFPSLDQDLCLRLPYSVSYAQATGLIYDFLDQAAQEHNFIGAVSPIDIYQKKNDKDNKQITWRIVLSHPERTLTTQEANKLLDELSVKARQTLKAERV